MAGAVHYIGVRHHSPACARLVRHTIAQLRPAAVLIEGPCDMNDRLDELLLQQELPFAIFSYAQAGPSRIGTWSPFCDYSPEWVGLVDGAAAGAAVSFIDLPGWHPVFAQRENRFADRYDRHEAAVAKLCEEFSVTGYDGLWDHLFEDDISVEEIGNRLEVYRSEIRDLEVDPPADNTREQHMAAWIASEQARHPEGDILVITGAYHTLGLQELVPIVAADATAAGPPENPVPPPETRHGSFLIPFSFRRLDSFGGYNSGMPSPAFYQVVWEEGSAAASSVMLEQIVERLRAIEQPISTADLIAARTMSGGLATLRRHEAELRSDLLDGLASAVLKTAQDGPLPWRQRGPLPPGTDPLLVQVVNVISGDRHGVLHPDTPHPPLVAQVQLLLARPELGPPRTNRTIVLDRTDSVHRELSEGLHQLRVLGIDGVRCTRGPRPQDRTEVTEDWALGTPENSLTHIIEAGAFGATLPGAASAKLTESVGAAAGEMDVIAGALFDAWLCGLNSLADDYVQALAASIGRASNLAELAAPLEVVNHLLHYQPDEPQLVGLLERMIDRALWLTESIRGGELDTDRELLRALIAARNGIRTTLPAMAVRAGAVGHRTAEDPTAPSVLRGAATGLTWSLPAGSAAQPDALSALGDADRNDRAGDFLAGLFALAREEMQTPAGAGLLAEVDQLVCAMTNRRFHEALPALRLSFSFFPPRERRALADRLLEARGLAPASSAFLHLSADAGQLATAAALEEAIDETLQRFLPAFGTTQP